LVIKTLDLDWIRIGIQQQMLDPDPDLMNPDRKHCIKGIIPCHHLILGSTVIGYKRKPTRLLHLVDIVSIPSLRPSTR
jgi:hypothetical protein